MSVSELKSYRVEVSICGSIIVEAESEDDALNYVKEGISNNNADIMETLGYMARQHLECGDVDIGSCYKTA